MHWFRLKYHWNLFLKIQLTIFKNWFRECRGGDQATSHYLNRWWPRLPTQICVTRSQYVTTLDVLFRILIQSLSLYTVYPKKYAHGFYFAVLCCGYTLTDFPVSIRLTSLALWQSDDCPSASKATLMNMDKYSMWIHYEQLHNHNKAKHNKTVCIFLGIYCTIASIRL